MNLLDINNSTKMIIAEYGKANSFDELAELFEKYNIISCVIDAQPEKHGALSFARKYPGRVKVCYFTRGVTGKSIINHGNDLSQPIINVDRTTWLDQALSRFRNRTIFPPTDLSIEYKNQVMEPVRVVKKDDKGNPISSYETRDNHEDHFAFSRTYTDIALAALSDALGGNHNIG